ncbi:hypothetical protein [Cerasicoccus fimbriatus]|uniref:hypothetical protein n=1 Tax=Cerasicoccus fimbriatus TaxID=3014554 RepID=UPI0022B31DA1|nr:hypothetical protein [Cerasicoccus sp. TK19100]
MQKVMGILLIFVASLLGLGAWMLPVYLDAVAPRVLRAVGAEGKPAAASADLLLVEGQQGPAWRINRALQQLPNSDEAYAASEEFLNGQIAAFMAEHPEDRLTGSVEAYGLQVMKMAPRPPELAADAGPMPFQRLLTQRDNREAVLALLQESRNQNVQQILQTRGMHGVRHFMPVASAAGAPLDSAILTTALLVQAGFIGPEFAREVATMAQLAMSGEGAAVSRMEAFYMSMLGAGQRLDWASLGAWARLARDPVTFMRATTLLRRSGERESLVFGVVMLSQRPDWLADYYEEFGDEAWADLEEVFPWGKQSLVYLLENQLPLYDGPAAQASGAEILPPDVEQVLVSFCANVRTMAIVVKILGLLLAGMLMAAGLKLLLTSRAEATSNSPGMAWMQNAVVGVILLLLVISFQEPQLFAQPVTEPGALFLEFELPAQVATVEGESMPNASIDQQTVLVLLIFFMMQLVIYIVCLMKLSTLKRAPVPAQTRITLLENEEPLFDLGLYVGLSGTVISLLMLAMGIVQASLVAAYASTLFGIIFVALLKILHVRPLKRKLILERS